QQALPVAASVLGLAFHPSGRLLAATVEEGMIRLCLPEVPGAPALILGPRPLVDGPGCVAFSPECRYLAASNPGGAVSLLRLPAPPRHRPGSPAPVPGEGE